MKDLVISGNVASAFPSIAAGLRKAQTLFDQIRSFEDIERVFLKGPDSVQTRTGPISRRSDSSTSSRRGSIRFR